MSHWRRAVDVPGLSRIFVSLVAGLMAGLPVLAGCGGDGDDAMVDAGVDAMVDAAPGVEIADACNPLGFEVCLMPWPSSAYLRDAETATGVQVELPVAAMPANGLGVPIDPAPFDRFDGFAPSGPMVVAFPGGVSAEGLPSALDPAVSLAPESPVVVVNMDTGARVPVFAEVDAGALFPEDAALIIRPAARLAPGTRHAVAIRKSVKALGGGALPVPPGFRAVLEGGTAEGFEHPRMARLASGYEAVFAALEAAGVARDDLVLAWDFVTASDAFLTRDLLAMRAQAVSDMGANGANLSVALTEVVSDTPPDPSLVHRLLSGTYEAPNFLTQGEDDASVLVRDAGGLPVLDGRYEANISVVIPACVTQAALPRPVIVFGHGLFGSGAGYLTDTDLQQMAEQACAVLVAGDFIGLTNRQVAAVASIATDMSLLDRITEKLAQSIINFIALEQLARGPLAADPLLQVDGQSVIDPAQIHYFGASLGGIMGNVLMAYDQTITRGVLGVPGGAWSLLLERSYAWGPLQGILSLSYEERESYPLLPALLGMHFEPYDAITTAARVLGNPLPNTPAKQILMYQTTGDSLVSNLSTDMVARTMGIPVIEPSVRVPYGLEAMPAPLASGMVIYDEHPSPLPPAGNVPPAEDNGTHSGIHERGAVLRQAMGFLLGGQIVNECSLDGQPAPCDCATGACE